MDATTMLSMRSLVKKLQKDFPEFIFESSTEFWWSATNNTVHYDLKTADGNAFLLHELSHAVLGHVGYQCDIDLIKLERDAWEYAKSSLGPHYDAPIDESTAEDNLDTYREWLHSRSTCPDCSATGLQMKQQHYRCLDCGAIWRVNEARLCSLRRYSLQTK